MPAPRAVVSNWRYSQAPAQSDCMYHVRLGAGIASHQFEMLVLAADIINRQAPIASAIRISCDSERAPIFSMM